MPLESRRRVPSALLRAALVILLGARSAAAVEAGPSTPVVNCSAFVVSGDAQSSRGATWVYASKDQGQDFRLEGVLFAPDGPGPFPAVLVSHGHNGSPGAYGAQLAATFVPWGLVVIAPMYTHTTADSPENLPDGPEGASDANLQRAHKTRDLLSCLGYVDLARLAAHGHSMGAYVTGQLLGAYPNDFLAGSHSAGGTRFEGAPGAGTDPEVAALIRTPYQQHHGELDPSITMDVALDEILTTEGAPHILYPYPDVGHDGMAFNPTMLSRVQVWYADNGVIAALPEVPALPARQRGVWLLGLAVLVAACGVSTSGRRKRPRRAGAP